MFRDLSELEHVFEQLENDCELPIQEKLNWICGKKSESNIRLNALMKSVHKRELAHGIIPGKSYQSKILGDLYYYLETCSKPSKLKASLPELKELLFKAYIIIVNQHIDSISQFSYEKSQFAEHGSKFRGNKRGKNKLNKLLLALLKEHGKKSVRMQIISKLAELANEGHEIIHEVDAEYVYWYTGKRETKTTIKRIQNAIYDLKKRNIIFPDTRHSGQCISYHEYSSTNLGNARKRFDQTNPH